MNDTPETDAAWKEGNAIREWTCRKLERERDEAREKAERYRLEANALMLQRDEAQNKLRLGKLTIISQKEEIELLRQQLIEARNK